MSGADNPAPRQATVVPMLRRIGEVVKTILGLVDSVAELKAKNDALSASVEELRREVDQQAGQIRVLIEFIRDALDERVEKRAEAAARAIVAEFERKSGKRPRSKKKK